MLSKTKKKRIKWQEIVIIKRALNFNVLFQWMAVNFGQFLHRWGEKNNRRIVLEKETDDTIDRALEQCFIENSNKKVTLMWETVVISSRHNYERSFRKIDSHKTYCRQEKQNLIAVKQPKSMCICECLINREIKVSGRRHVLDRATKNRKLLRAMITDVKVSGKEI